MEYSKNFWQNRWNKNTIGFHMSQTHPDLVKYESLFNECSKVLVPLCGKSVDLVYLADRGYDVYGCEFVTKAVQDFFKEQSLEYRTSSLSCDKITVYKAISKRITLYQGDFFALKSKDIGKYDSIWDRGSLVAINPSERNKYVEVMHDIMAPKCKYLLKILVIDGDTYQGPPYSIPIDSVSKLFGDFCEIKVLDTKMIDPFPEATSVTVVNVLLTTKTLCQ